MKKELASVKGEVELLRTMLDAAKQQLQEGSGSSGYNTLVGDEPHSNCGNGVSGGGNGVVVSPSQSSDSVTRPVSWPF